MLEFSRHIIWTIDTFLRRSAFAFWFVLFQQILSFVFFLLLLFKLILFLFFFVLFFLQHLFLFFLLLDCFLLRYLLSFFYWLQFNLFVPNMKHVTIFKPKGAQTRSFSSSDFFFQCLVWIKFYLFWWEIKLFSELQRSYEWLSYLTSDFSSKNVDQLGSWTSRF